MAGRKQDSARVWDKDKDNKDKDDKDNWGSSGRGRYGSGSTYGYSSLSEKDAEKFYEKKKSYVVRMVKLEEEEDGTLKILEEDTFVCWALNEQHARALALGRPEFLKENWGVVSVEE